MSYDLNGALRSAIAESDWRYESLKGNVVHECAGYIFQDAKTWVGTVPAEEVPERVQRNVVDAAQQMSANSGLFRQVELKDIIALLYRELKKSCDLYHQREPESMGGWSGWRYTEDEELAWECGRGKVEFRELEPLPSLALL